MGPLRMSFETSFDLKQAKLEPKLVSALSKTKRLFGFFACISKQRVSMFWLNRNTQNQPKQFDREHILVFFLENLVFFRFVLVCFGLF
jgi:hypothetical protein